MINDTRLERGISFLHAHKVGRDKWAYYADETSSYWVVCSADLRALCDYQDDPDPGVSSDAYSHWCAGTVAKEMPKGWEP